MRVPSIYNFPPFFTRQLNDNTWHSQKAAWQMWILLWCRENRQTSITINPELLESSLLHNSTIHSKKTLCITP